MIVADEDYPYPCMTRAQVDWLYGRQYFDAKIGAIAVVGREQVGWSPQIQADLYVAVVEDACGGRYLRDLSQIDEELPNRYTTFRAVLLEQSSMEIIQSEHI